MESAQAKKKKDEFVIPGRRMLAVLVFTFFVVYAVVVFVERWTGVIGWGLFGNSVLAGVGFALPIADKAFSFHANKVSERWVPLALVLLAFFVSGIAVWIGIQVGLSAASVLPVRHNVWESALLGFETFFAVISSLLLVDGWEHVSLGHDTFFPPELSQKETTRQPPAEK